jgi:hypothetical protein
MGIKWQLAEALSQNLPQQTKDSWHKTSVLAEIPTGHHLNKIRQFYLLSSSRLRNKVSDLKWEQWPHPLFTLQTNKDDTLHWLAEQLMVSPRTKDSGFVNCCLLTQLLTQLIQTKQLTLRGRSWGARSLSLLRQRSISVNRPVLPVAWANAYTTSWNKGFIVIITMTNLTCIQEALGLDLGWGVSIPPGKFQDSKYLI